MSFRSKFALVVLSASLALYTVIGGYISTRAQNPAQDPSANLRIFESVLQHIKHEYVDEPPLEKVRAGALRGLAYGLDPYSTYLTADQVSNFGLEDKGNQSGIGAELSQVASYLYVIAPIKGSPAEKAGIQAGDIIEYIDNKATRDISLYDARQMLNGTPGSEVKLRILRANTKPLAISVRRGSFKTPQAEARTETGRIGVLHVHSLADGEANDIRSRLQELLKQGVQKVVLDLRSVASGSLTEATKVTNLFIKEGVLAQTIGRENKTLQTFTADPKEHLFGGPLVVIIDRGTAGAAEIIASAVLELKRGEVVGEKSFGAGAEQQLFKLRDGDGLLLTTVKWASSKGIPFLSTGITPSVEVKRPELAEPVDLDELTGNEEDGITGPSPEKREVAPEPAPRPAEDIQLKKALELLQDKAQTKQAA
jgi:carboxyl-terminal processing protease